MASGKVKPAYCNIPSGTTVWGFHVGAPITGATGTYARGHGTLSGNSTGGIVCQVDRVRSAADRQIVLTVGSRLVGYKHAVLLDGHLGNILKLTVRVKTSTDPQCAVGTTGKLTLTATYNGIHDDSARLAFPRACRRHDHYYTGSRVFVLIPAHT